MDRPCPKGRASHVVPWTRSSQAAEVEVDADSIGHVLDDPSRSLSDSRWPEVDDFGEATRFDLRVFEEVADHRCDVRQRALAAPPCLLLGQAGRELLSELDRYGLRTPAATIQVVVEMSVARRASSSSSMARAALVRSGFCQSRHRWITAMRAVARSPSGAHGCARASMYNGQW